MDNLENFGHATLAELFRILVRPSRYGPKDLPHSQRGWPREDKWFYDLWQTKLDKNDLRDVKQLVFKLFASEQLHIFDLGDPYYTMTHLCHFNGIWDLSQHFGVLKKFCSNCYHSHSDSHWTINSPNLDKLLDVVQCVQKLAPKLLDFSNIRSLQFISIYADDLKKIDHNRHIDVDCLLKILIAFRYLKQYNPHFWWAREQAERERTYFLIGLEMPIPVVQTVERARGWALVAEASKSWSVSY